MGQRGEGVILVEERLLEMRDKGCRAKGGGSAVRVGNFFFFLKLMSNTRNMRRSEEIKIREYCLGAA